MRNSVFKKLFSLVCLAALLLTLPGITAFAAYENTYVNTGDQIADLIGVARTQVGFTEASDKTTKYGAYLGHADMDWCGAFIAWCANEAGIAVTVIPKNGSSNGLKDFYDTNGVYYLSPGHGGTYRPKAGDIAFVSFTNSPSNITHVGIVVSVTDDTINTIEGNYGDRVSEVAYPMDTTKIVGFGAPKYTTSDYRTGYYKLKAELPLRSSTSAVTDSNILLTIPNGTTVRVSAINGSWGYAYYSGLYGWMELESGSYERPLDTGAPAEPKPENALYLVADVSKFTEPTALDWAKMREAGVMGVIIRIGGRGYGRDKTLYRDTQFMNHYTRAKAAGMAVGVYFFSYALNAEQARQEAQMTIDILRENDCKLDMPVFIDIEDYSESDYTDKQHEVAGKTVCSTVVNTFCDVIEEAGYYPGVYCNKYFAENLLDSGVFSGRAAWIAHYGVTKCGYNGRVDLWQYTPSGRVQGYSGRLDLSYCYVDFPSIINGTVSGNFGEHVPEEDWEIVQEPTCETEGKQIKKCADCGITLITETIPRTAHTSSVKCVLPGNTTLKVLDTIPTAIIGVLHPESDASYEDVYYPLYERGGGTLLTYCVDCHKVTAVTYSYGETTHEPTETKTVDATCAKEGVQKTICSDCGKTLNEKLIPYTEHLSGETKLVQASCLTGGERVTACAVCSGTIRTAYAPPEEHAFDSGTVTESPTVRRDGKITYTCTKCGEQKSSVLPAPLYGDVNGDKTVTAEDARLALRAAIRLETLTVTGQAAADADNSGKLESVDARIILRLAVKLEDTGALLNKYYPLS